MMVIPSHRQTAKMQAITQDRYGNADVLEKQDIPVPTPGKGQVLLKVSAAGVDRGVWHVMTGKPYLIRIMGYGLTKPKQATAGLDVSGVVVAVGDEVQRLSVGDRVFGIANGSYAQYALASADKIAALPTSISTEEGGVLAVSGVTADTAVREVSAVQQHERVLVIGASGGVGSFAVQIARACGAHVTGVCRHSKAQFVRSIGAENVISYDQENWLDSAQQYDVIIDTGGNTPLRKLRRLLTPTGRLTIVGGENGGTLAGGIGRQIGASLRSMFTKQKLAFFLSKQHHEPLEKIAALVAEKKIRVPLTTRYHLEDAPRAIDDMVLGKISGKAAVIVDPALTSENA